MRIKSAKFVFLLLAAGCAVQLTAQNLPRQFDFAKLKVGDWSLRAETEIMWAEEQSKKFPRIEEVNCYGQSPDADFSMNSSAAVDLMLRFRGPDEDGGLGEITATGDHLWLYVDGERWEYANIERRPSELLNVEYPVYNREEEIIIPVWRGFQAVRKSPKDPWTNFDLIQGKLLSAKKLAWGFKSRDWNVVNRELNELPNGWQNARYLIDSTHWREVTDWCSRQVASEEARTLPADLLKYIEP